VGPGVEGRAGLAATLEVVQEFLQLAFREEGDISAG
jgi:hypothetical protein